MSEHKHLPESFLVRNIPGLGHFRRGHHGYGALLFLGFALFPVVIALHFREVVAGIVSFFLSLTMLGLEPSMKSFILRPELVEHWVAALFAIMAPIMIWSFDRKYIIRTAGTPETMELSQSDISFNAFVVNKVAVTGLVIIAALYSVAFLCPYLAPQDPNFFQNGIVTQYQPPMSTTLVLHLKEGENNPYGSMQTGRSFEYPALYASLTQVNRTLLRNTRPAIHYVDAYRIELDSVITTVGKDRKAFHIAKLAGFEPEEFVSEQLHILGTDSYGRDLLSRIIYGSRISLSLGFIAVLLSVVLGSAIGLSAGYFGGKVDSIIMRFVDVLLAFPSLFLILIFIAVFEKTEAPRILLIVLILGLTTWMGVARLVRGEVLSLKNRDFIFAAKAIGLSHMRILRRHLLPNVLTPIIINATLRIGGIILLEAALSYLNLGVQQPTASWGNIIYEGKDFLGTAWWISTLPGFAIVLTVVSFNLVGDGLRDAFDPRMKNS